MKAVLQKGWGAVPGPKRNGNVIAFNLRTLQGWEMRRVKGIFRCSMGHQHRHLVQHVVVKLIKYVHSR